MGHIYTPGLTVSPRAAVVKKRILPIPGRVLVHKGELIGSDKIIAQAELPGKVHVVNVVNQLGILPEDLKEFMVKREGDPVQKGEVLAENKPFIKWFKTTVTSPITGTVETISNATGQVLLREPPRRLDMFGYIDGTVAEVIPGQGVRIDTTCAFIQGIFGVGGEAWGSLVMVAAGPEAPLEASHLTSDHMGKIVIGGSFIGIDALRRAKTLGVKGIVVGGMHDKDLRALLGYDLGVAITGTENIGFTLILTEGFGQIPMAKKTFTLLQSLHGHKASISGATQIRAGVMRPEIIVPHSLIHTQSVAPPGDNAVISAAKDRGGAKIGDPVRIIREPHFGWIGEVIGLPSELMKIPTESDARVMEVRFADGTIALVPRANVEIIEGA
jgi:hypothetical protein